ncbi:hypothetical protein ASG36_14660 [Geodermatophilus sp. Leaf369]|uniref:hypothetical protein n=1 Tax=Geodermatophilus sp. Leaf369 TaxID=1736354 RepID=UPI0006F661BD|nr:hypothetical protein [Geodermatophilus sp. Leaf369]KQS57830.1 hypothetical protein ASG36_14660 [Geodermatophilus sp. Leaf369]
MSTQQHKNGYFEIPEGAFPGLVRLIRRRNKEIADAQRLARLRRLARKQGLRIVTSRWEPNKGTYGVVDVSGAWVLYREAGDDENFVGCGLTLAGVERGLKRLAKG